MTTINKPTTTPVLIEDLGYLYPNENSKRKVQYGLYRCECGNEWKAQTVKVKMGNTKSCGCYRLQRIKAAQTTHGLSTHPLYNILAKMIARTTDQNSKDFKNYGGRGISVCDEWLNNPQAFFDWCYENGHKEGLFIDRINNDKVYSPENCRWTTREVQARNTRRIMATNTSGYRGVASCKYSRKCRAVIGINGRQKHLGYFETPLEAAIAYDSYVLINNLEHTINGVISHNDEPSRCTDCEVN